MTTKLRFWNVGKANAFIGAARHRLGIKDDSKILHVKKANWEVETLADKLGEAAATKLTEAINNAPVSRYGAPLWEKANDKSQYVQFFARKAGATPPAQATAPAAKAEPVDPKTEFPKLVFAVMAKGKSKAQAVELCVKEFPIMHREWVDSGCASNLSEPAQATGPFADLVARRVAAGQSKAEAVQFCVQQFPVSYAAWRAGDTSKL